MAAGFSEAKPLRTFRPANLAAWRGRFDRDQIAPVIAIAGTRGKTSTVRVLESIFNVTRARIATWTDVGVEIEGQRQRGELGPWSRALTRLKAGGIDVALQEIDWATVPLVGTQGEKFPVVAVANLCANSEACLVTPDMLLARRALARLRERVAPGGRLVINADDFAVADGDSPDSDRYLVGLSEETPILSRHLRNGGDACWVDEGRILLQEGQSRFDIGSIDQLPSTRFGAVSFAVQNALMATAIARVCGVPFHEISDGLIAHEPLPERVPGSFNVFDTDRGTIVVDEPAPSWFLRTTLRAASGLGPGRQIRVAGPMANIDTEELDDVGRLLGRGGGVLLLHGLWDTVRLDAIRLGIASTELPPLIAQVPDERAAIQQGLDMLRPDDVMLVLAEQPATVIKLIDRRVRRRSFPEPLAPGAA